MGRQGVEADQLAGQIEGVISWSDQGIKVRLESTTFGAG